MNKPQKDPKCTQYCICALYICVNEKDLHL